MQALAEKLKGNRLLCHFSEEVLEKDLIPQGHLRQYEKNATVFSAQDRVDRFHILLSGQVNIVQFLYDGTGNLLTKLSPPNIVGLDLVCTRTQISPYHALISEACALFSFPASVLLEPGILPEYQRLRAIGTLLTMLSHLNMQKEYRLSILTRRGLRERITVYLTMQAKKRGIDSFSIPFDREELAAFLGVNRSALSHELSLMRQEGLIDFQGSRFTLLALGRPEDSFPAE